MRLHTGILHTHHLYYINAVTNYYTAGILHTQIMSAMFLQTKFSCYSFSSSIIVTAVSLSIFLNFMKNLMFI